ncbi:hypothetical protein VH571_14990 [Frondihabitans sp. 4ASC-45]|uniref:hypothetical protein n=1 Tax=Frondihabitans sp. 4ASC-45 TaxID=3111636 RepID=UPI003C243062
MEVLIEPIEDDSSFASQPPTSTGIHDSKESDVLFWLGKYADEAYVSSDARNEAEGDTPRVQQLDFGGITMGAVRGPVMWASEEPGGEESLPGYTQEMRQCIHREHDESYNPKKETTEIIRSVVGIETSKVDVSSAEKSAAPDGQTAFQEAIRASTQAKFGIKDETSNPFVAAVLSAWESRFTDRKMDIPVTKTFSTQVPTSAPIFRGKCMKMVTTFYQVTEKATAHVWQKIDGDFSFQLLRDAEDKTPAGFGRFKSYKVTMSPATAIFGLSTGELPNQSKSIYQPYLAPSADRLKARTADFPSGEFRVVEEPGRPATVEVHRTVEVHVPRLYSKTSYYVQDDGQTVGDEFTYHSVDIDPEPQHPFRFYNPWPGAN